MDILIMVLGILDFLIGIFVLVKLFKREGVLKGILGIICMLYTFIWGWIHVKDENLMVMMVIWTIITIAWMVIYYLGIQAALQALPPASYLPFFVI